VNVSTDTRATAQVAVEAIVNAPSGYDAPTKALVLREGERVGVSETYLGMLRTIVANLPILCDCGDPLCWCGCLAGGYPCEHGTAGEGC